GYEFWADQAGHLHCKLIHDFQAGNYLDVVGTTDLADGKKHAVACTYDGTSAASGIHIYIDGISETTTTNVDNLTGSTIDPNQDFLVGNQVGDSFGVAGVFNYLQIDGVVRSQSYIAANMAPGHVPPVDADTILSLPLTEGTGTTANDVSGGGH